ncbi:MAG: protease modulator HflC [Spirochaetaceae bacterium]
MNKLVTTIVVIAVVLVVFVLLGPFFVVEEGEQAIVIRFGEIVNSETEAGLKLKTPLVDNVITFPKRIQSWDGDPRRIPTEENQFIWVDTTARWRITDPELFYASVTTVDAAYSRLDDLIESAVRQVITGNRLHEAVRDSNIINEMEPEQPVEADIEELDDEGVEEIADLVTVAREQERVSRGRRELSQEMFESAAEVTPDFGIELIDIVVRQIRYSDDLTESVYDRMVSERRRIARAYRSWGEGRKEEILGEIENERQQVISQAEREAQEIRGQADADAARIYAQAYGADPEFFRFWRALASYEDTLPRFRKTLTTDLEYFDFLYSETGQ